MTTTIFLASESSAGDTPNHDASGDLPLCKSGGTMVRVWYKSAVPLGRQLEIAMYIAIYCGGYMHSTIVPNMLGSISVEAVGKSVAAMVFESISKGKGHAQV